MFCQSPAVGYRSWEEPPTPKSEPFVAANLLSIGSMCRWWQDDVLNPFGRIHGRNPPGKSRLECGSCPAPDDPRFAPSCLEGRLSWSSVRATDVRCFGNSLASFCSVLGAVKAMATLCGGRRWWPSMYGSKLSNDCGRNVDHRPYTVGFASIGGLCSCRRSVVMHGRLAIAYAGVDVVRRTPYHGW